MEAVYPPPKAGIRADSPAAAPPGINFHIATTHCGRRGGGPKKQAPAYAESGSAFL